VNDKRRKALLDASEHLNLALIALNNAVWLPWSDLEEGDEYTDFHNVVDIRHEIEGQDLRLHRLRQRQELSRARRAERPKVRATR